MIWVSLYLDAEDGRCCAVFSDMTSHASGAIGSMTAPMMESPNTRLCLTVLMDEFISMEFQCYGIGV